MFNEQMEKKVLVLTSQGTVTMEDAAETGTMQ